MASRGSVRSRSIVRVSWVVSSSTRRLATPVPQPTNRANFLPDADFPNHADSPFNLSVAVNRCNGCSLPFASAVPLPSPAQFVGEGPGMGGARESHDVPGSTDTSGLHRYD